MADKKDPVLGGVCIGCNIGCLHLVAKSHDGTITLWKCYMCDSQIQEVHGIMTISSSGRTYRAMQMVKV